MTRAEIMALDGHALRMAVAEHVMGWTQQPCVWCGELTWMAADRKRALCCVDDEGDPSAAWEYSFDVCLAPEGPVATWRVTCERAGYNIDETEVELEWRIRVDATLTADGANHDGTPAGIATAMCRCLLLAVMEEKG